MGFSFLLAFDWSLADILLGPVGIILYQSFSILFIAVDTVQTVFTAFAGIGDIRFGGTTIKGDGGSSPSGGEANEQGIIYYLMQSEAVTNLLFSIMMLALLLIVIFTTMAFLKNLYVSKPKNWKEIISSSIKGLANFIFLPVCCLLGVWMGNILLQAIDGATRNSENENLSRRLFICCAYNANEYRTGAAEGAGLAKEIVTEYVGSDAANSIQEGQTNEYYAEIVDSVYLDSDKINLFWVTTAQKGYSLWQINYIILVAGGSFMLYVLGSLAFAMIKRIFYLLVLFIVSPAVCALYPLDDGSAVKSWSGEVKKQILSAYGAVAGLNIFFCLLPIINRIELIGWGAMSGFVNMIVQLFITISGLLMVKDFIQLLSGFVGGDNAYSSGSGLMKNAHGAFKKHAGKVAGKAAGVHGAFSKANATRNAGGSWWGSMKGSVKDGFKGGAENIIKETMGIDIGANKKTIKAAKEAGEKAGKEQKEARELHEKAEKFTTKHNHLQNGLASAKAVYDRYAKGQEGAGLSPEEKKAKLKELQKEIDAKQEEYYNFVEKSPAKVKQESFGEMGKKEGKTAEQMEAEFMSGRDQLRARRAAESAQEKLAESNAYLDAFAAKVRVNEGDRKDKAYYQARKTAVDDEFGAGTSALLDKLGVTVNNFEDLAEFMKRGMHLNTEGKKLNTQEQIVADNFNKRVDDEQRKRQSYQGDIDKYVEMMVKAAEKLAEGGQEVKLAEGGKVSITEETISKLATDISQGNKLDTNSEKIIKAITEDAKSRESALQKILSDIEKIEKALKKDDKK